MSIFNRISAVKRRRGRVVWRVGRKPDVWAFVDWKWSREGRFEGCWDAPDGSFRSIYSALSVYGSALEVLAHFRPDPLLVEELDKVESRESDVSTIPCGQVPREWLFNRGIGRASLHGRYLRITSSAVLSRLRSALGRDFDASDLKSAGQRDLTQQVARHVRTQGDVDGIEYLSRHGDEVVLFATFEKDSDDTHSALIRESATRDIRMADPEFSRAMETLGLAWADEETLPGPVMEQVSDEEMALAFFPPDGIPRVTDPLGVAMLWLMALNGNELDALRYLTWHLESWDLEETRRLADGHTPKQRVEWPAEDASTRDDIAYVGLVRGMGGVVMEAAFLYAGDVVWLTTVKQGPRWYVWSIGHQAPPSEVRL